MRLNRKEERDAIAMKTLGYYSGFGGLEIKAVEYGIDEAIIFIVGAWTGTPEGFRSVIQYNRDGEAFFKYRNAHIYLNDCLRV